MKLLLTPNIKPMKRLVRSLVFVCCISFPFTSCIDIIEDMILKKDGTGTYAVTIDMGEMMNDPMLKGLMETDEKNKEKNKDIDSTVQLGDLPDSLIAENPDLWKRTKMHIYSNSKEEAFFVKISLDFKNVSEIAYLSANINKVMEKAKANPLGEEQASSGGSPGLLNEGIGYVLNGKELVRKTSTPQADEPTEDLEMMKSFLGSAEYKMNFEMPGKVKKATFPNAKVVGKKVSVVIPFLDILEKKANPDGMIGFK